MSKKVLDWRGAGECSGGLSLRLWTTGNGRFAHFLFVAWDWRLREGG
ncbi:hypothetical protein [Azoarcus sp. DD4]|nr:hypothetical protein [Azoarcus sp. DD4]